MSAWRLIHPRVIRTVHEEQLAEHGGADAVRSALAQTHGIAASRLNAHDVAFLAPVASNAEETGRAQNRQVELLPF